MATFPTGSQSGKFWKHNQTPTVASVASKNYIHLVLLWTFLKGFPPITVLGLNWHQWRQVTRSIWCILECQDLLCQWSCPLGNHWVWQSLVMAPSGQSLRQVQEGAGGWFLKQFTCVMHSIFFCYSFRSNWCHFQPQRAILILLFFQPRQGLLSNADLIQSHIYICIQLRTYL